MCGCDYLDNVKGVGVMGLLKLHADQSNLQKSLKALFTQKLGIKGATNYLQQVELTMLSFLYQLVYRKGGKGKVKLSNLTQLPETVTQMDKQVLEQFTGQQFGNIDAHSKGLTERGNAEVLRPRSEVDFAKVLRFFNFKPPPCLGLMTDRTVRSINFDNFEQFLEQSQTKSEADSANEEDRLPPRTKAIQKRKSYANKASLRNRTRPTRNRWRTVESVRNQSN